MSIPYISNIRVRHVGLWRVSDGGRPVQFPETHSPAGERRYGVRYARVLDPMADSNQSEKLTPSRADNAACRPSILSRTARSSLV
jgi:hypothetical protein